MSEDHPTGLPGILANVDKLIAAFGGFPVSTPRDALVRYWAEVNAYKDKEPAVPEPTPATPEPDDDGPVKAIVVSYIWEDRVRLVGGELNSWGFVTGISARPNGVTYEVSWPESRSTSTHYDFELEDADS